MLKKIIIFISVFVIGLNVILLLTDNLHLYKTIVYNYVDIDDDDLFYHRVIEAKDPKAWPLSKDYNQIALDESAMQELLDRKSVAFLVVKDDSLLFEKYWESYGESSLSNSFSMAKSIISILIGIAIDEGKIKSLDQKAGDFIEHFNNEKSNELTIRNLLMMSSGLSWDESYGSMFSLTTKAYYGSDLKKMVEDMEVVGSPGNSYKYLSGNSLVLGMILENAVGKSVSEYASEKLWTPINAEHNAEWSLDHENGMEKAYCCFYSNARDFARLGQLYLNDGKWNGKQIVSEDYVKQSIVSAPIKDEHGKPNHKYGLHWWLMSRSGYDIFYARGILGQYIAVIPDLNIVMVRLGHIRGEKLSDGHISDFVKYVDGVIASFGE
ncbi:MAG: serine hydrolase [Bacteroidia bacterium]|nr:serine hydrolase [Bacteroidia bacterium]